MATILAFRKEPRRSAAAPARPPLQGSAEIVFFPGIRYERWTDEAPAKPKRTTKRRRDRLKIND